MLTVSRLEIVKSWFNLMDEDGWIAREQILGAEARSKVPPEFTVQYPHYANPPTLFMILESFVDRFNKSAAPRIDLDREDIADSLRSAHLENRDLAYAYLRSIYPLLKRHYYWFRKTQRGDIKSYDRDAYSAKEAYRWRGRTVQHILTSGLDDYPRAQPPHPGELHTDLISWMGLASRSLRRIAEALGEKEDTEEFGAHEKAIVRNIDDLHWDEEAQTYCDATIDDYEESVHVCHKGYISIFPFLTGIVGPDSPRLKPILDLIRDPEELWTDYGIRSLSKKDPFYGTAENYWRSPIWMNINYLVLKNLYVSRLFSKTPFLFLFPSDGERAHIQNFFRISQPLLGLTGNRPVRCIPISGRIWSRMSSRSGRELVSRGSSTTRIRDEASGRSTSRAGRAWW